MGIMSITFQQTRADVIFSSDKDKRHSPSLVSNVPRTKDVSLYKFDETSDASHLRSVDLLERKKYNKTRQMGWQTTAPWIEDHEYLKGGNAGLWDGKNKGRSLSSETDNEAKSKINVRAKALYNRKHLPSTARTGWNE